jgi:hypothetical protein
MRSPPPGCPASTTSAAVRDSLDGDGRDDDGPDDAQVRSWVRADRVDLDVVLRTTVAEWLQATWPFAVISTRASSCRASTFCPRPRRRATVDGVDPCTLMLHVNAEGVAAGERNVGAFGVGEVEACVPAVADGCAVIGGNRRGVPVVEVRADRASRQRSPSHATAGVERQRP